MSIPYLEAKGTNRQIGEAIGEHLRDDIEVALSRFEKHNKLTPKLKARRAKLSVAAKNFFPEYIEELRGMAEAAKQPFERLLSFSFEEELMYRESCSTLAVNTGRTILFGHNEDWDYSMPLYVLKAKPKNKPAFLSLGYTGQLPTTSVGMNDAGLVFSVNSIVTKVVDTGLPKLYCLRSMLSARTLDEAVERIAVAGRASGNASVVVHKKDLYILEWSPTHIGIETCEPWVAHANRYILPEMKEDHLPAVRGSTSVNRLQQMWNWLVETPVATVHDMKKLLSDHTHNPQSLCRHDKGDVTISSVVIDVAQRKMEVAYGNPCHTPYQRFWL